jgi:hypothetical protein
MNDYARKLLGSYLNDHLAALVAGARAGETRELGCDRQRDANRSPAIWSHIHAKRTLKRSERELERLPGSSEPDP